MSYKILSKFIKDISFEIPNAQTFLMIEKEIAKYTLKFNIKSKPFKAQIMEVNTILSLEPNQEVKHKMLCEINYTSLVEINSEIKDKKELEKIILIKIPKEIYTDIYELFVQLYAKSGIPNISIQKEVDFEKMYNENMKS